MRVFLAVFVYTMVVFSSLRDTGVSEDGLGAARGDLGHEDGLVLDNPCKYFYDVEILFPKLSVGIFLPPVGILQMFFAAATVITMELLLLVLLGSLWTTAVCLIA